MPLPSERHGRSYFRGGTIANTTLDAWCLGLVLLSGQYPVPLSVISGRCRNRSRCSIIDYYVLLVLLGEHTLATADTLVLCVAS